MTMQITFAIRGMDGAALDEAQARAALDAGTLPTNEPYLFGWLRFLHPEQRNLDLNDDLNLLFPDCLGAVSALRTRGRAELSLASHYCHFTLIAEGDIVHVFKEDSDVHGAEVARYPKEELIEALTACCRRFAAYAQALAALDPRWTALRDMMAESSDEALSVEQQ